MNSLLHSLKDLDPVVPGAAMVDTGKLAFQITVDQPVDREGFGYSQFFILDITLSPGVAAKPEAIWFLWSLFKACEERDEFRAISRFYSDEPRHGMSLMADIGSNVEASLLAEIKPLFQRVLLICLNKEGLSHEQAAVLFEYCRGLNRDIPHGRSKVVNLAEVRRRDPNHVGGLQC